MKHIFAALLSSVLTLSVLAGSPQHQSSMMGHEMHESMQKMNKDMMDMKMTGDAEVDFMQMMIPHHQGAIDMSKIYLKYGTSSEIRARAEKIISDQSKEIEQMVKLIDAEKASQQKGAR